MKVLWCLFPVVALLPSLGTAQEQPREKYIAEVVKVVGVEDLFEQVKKDQRENARKTVDQMLTQMEGLMARLSDAQRQELRAAVDRFLQTALSGLDTPDAAAAWGRFFAADLSDDELKRIVDYAHEPLGRKQLQASASASRQWMNYMAEKERAAMTKGIEQYVAEVKRIVSEKKEPAAPTSAPPK